MSGIISSCCPFLTNAETEGRGSPPYTSDDIRLRLHNLTNSLSGSTQIPRQVSASDKDKPGLPELSSESSAITFVKSDTSFETGEGEGECKVILPAREGCSEMDQAMAAAVAADFHPISDGDWETEKGLEEEEVTLLQIRQAGDDEVDVTCLERKAAKTVLPLKPQVAYPKPQLSSALPFKNKAISNHPSLPHIPEQPPELVSPSDAESTAISPASPGEASQEIPEPSTSQDPRSVSPSTLSEPPAELPPTNPQPTLPLLAEDPTQASSSSELLDAISNLSAARYAGKSRRSRMTSTRAPTPWSAAGPEEEDDEELDQVAEEEQLERIDSSGSSSLYESADGTTESSYHTLPTASNSVERADLADDQLPAQAAAEAETTTAATETAAETPTEMAIETRAEATIETTAEATIEITAEAAIETTAEVIAAMETETTEETITASAVSAAAVQLVETITATTAETAAQQQLEMAAESAAEPVVEPAPDAAEGTASGDQPPPNVSLADDVNLRYFCGAFRPVDHFMTRYAGLEAAVTPPEPLAISSGRSDSAVLSQVQAVSDRGRGAASDSTLPLGVRSSSPGPPAADDSGVQLEAKRSSTAIPM